MYEFACRCRLEATRNDTIVNINLRDEKFRSKNAAPKLLSIMYLMRLPKPMLSMKINILFLNNVCP